VTIRVAIADDHSLVRQGLRRYLELADGIEVIGEAANGNELVELVEKESPQIALVDIRMPEMDGLEAARVLRDRYPSVGVIMLTAYDDRQFVVEAVRSGARGYVLKARDAEHLIQTVRLVAGGNMVIDPQLVVALAEPRPSRRGRSRSCSSSPSGTRTGTSPNACTSRPTRSRPTSSTSSRSSAPPTERLPSLRPCGAG
jgi:DNA-binding NarL/FixJ family response regulator